MIELQLYMFTLSLGGYGPLKTHYQQHNKLAASERGGWHCARWCDDDKFKSSNHKLSTKHLAPVENTKQYPDDPKHVAAQGYPKDSAEKVDIASTKLVRKIVKTYG